MNITNIYLFRSFGDAELRATDEEGTTYIIENGTLALYDLIKEKGYHTELKVGQKIKRLIINR